LLELTINPVNTVLSNPASHNDRTIDAILESLVAVLPVFHRRILRMDLGGTTGSLTRVHLGIMAKLSEGNVSVSELARASIVPKPQMTRLIGQLVATGVVARLDDPADRRVTLISLTERGRLLHAQVKARIEDNLRDELRALSPDELVEMSQALETLRRVVVRLRG
jgi:DNA-binding MarR family transcriptional regulator